MVGLRGVRTANFSTRLRKSGGTSVVRGRTKHAKSVEKLGSDLVGSRFFQNGETGCFCKNLDLLYPWLGMVENRMALPLEQKSISEVVTKRKPSLCNDDEIKPEKKRKLGN